MANIKNSSNGNIYGLLAWVFLILWILNFLFYPSRENIFLFPNIGLSVLAIIASIKSGSRHKGVLIIIALIVLVFATISSMYLYGSNQNRNL